MTAYKPKLIEVALPLAAINAEAAREKSIRMGHPSTLHLWWARRPLAAARAVIWASLVDDPSGNESLSVEEQEAERQRLFRILERLVKWENSNDAGVLEEASSEIERCFPNGPPPVVDPFGGGGTIPLEAQRLGLKALSGDLNPVAILIQKAMIEVPPRFADCQPVHPDLTGQLTTWQGNQSLAADVTAYGESLRTAAWSELQSFYPAAHLSNGTAVRPIAWIWARTVESPDPTWRGHVPLVSSWVLSKKQGRPTVWIDPKVDREAQTISYEIREGGQPTYERTCSGGKGICLATGATIPSSYIKETAQSGRMNHQLIAIVAEQDGGRIFLPPDANHEAISRTAVAPWRPESRLPQKGLGFRVQPYGLTSWADLFTERQLLALSTYSRLIEEIHQQVLEDARTAGFSISDELLAEGGSGARAYADAVVTYLALGLSRMADMTNALCMWESSRTQVRHLFTRQAIPMLWDFAENNVFNEAGGDFRVSLRSVVRALERLPARGSGEVVQRDARARLREVGVACVSTDPPYYDNVGYADLSDFFFVWLRRNLSGVWPEICATLLTPKADEMIADPSRHGGPRGAELHFETGIAEFMAEVAKTQTPEVPATIYYAYKATETQNGETRSTGWDTFLTGVIRSGMQITATWPMRTELANRMRGLGSNALASSIVLACRRRSVDAPMASRGEFIAALRSELPAAVRILQSGNIAPVDLAQSTIGPGIGVFSRYAKVVEADGSPMAVASALSVINDVLGEVLDGEEAELDADTRFASTWYTQHGYQPAGSGEADGLARAKNTSLGGIQSAGIGEARAGKFRLYERSELNPDWSPVGDDRLTVWEATQHLVAALERSESEAAALLHQLGGYADRARQLSYVLFRKVTDNGWADEASAYNTLITAWPTLQAMTGSDDNQQQLL